MKRTEALTNRISRTRPANAGTRAWRLLGRAKPRACLALLFFSAFSVTTLAQDPYAGYSDASSDTMIRLTDPGADGAFDPQAHALIDLLEVSIGKWTPFDPPNDLFAGEFEPQGKFIRLDLKLAGLVNPPGSTHPEQFTPFAYGPNPVYGFVEVDMDLDVETGGELDAPHYRYVGNIARFGSKPAQLVELADRIAEGASAFDGDFLTPPYVERSGEEYHLALLGELFQASDIVHVADDGDLTFESNETWWIVAPWFHRAHGYEPFSLATGGAFPGEYSPVCTLQFRNDDAADATWVSLVFPLKNQGAGLMVEPPESPEAPNGDPSDQFSVREGLIDLHDSAVFLDSYPTGLPEEAIITEWQNKDPSNYLEPAQWALTVLLGTSYTVVEPAGEYFIWTDAYPDGLRGDVNGDAEVDQSDKQAIAQFIIEEDASDGEVDGCVSLSGFAENFSIFDISYDGGVNNWDQRLLDVHRILDDGRHRARPNGPMLRIVP